mmetsp:Transcript_11652/g.18961  ORF Transcript_11652/g.18961 Transcript_11652/m.18961 type:complete len:341 (-) Transcript_11652:42-1064(-)
MAAAVSNERKEYLRKAIRYLSISMLILYVTKFILNLTVFEYNSDNSFTIPFSLAVAYCGIIGVYRMHRDVLSCFYICCVASVCLYLIDVLIQTRRLVVDKSSPRLIKLGVSSLLLETILACIQCTGVVYGRELVRNYLVVQFRQDSSLYNHTTFSVGYVQELGDIKNHLERVKKTIANIPEEVYTKEKVETPSVSPSGSPSGSQSRESVGCGQVAHDDDINTEGSNSPHGTTTEGSINVVIDENVQDDDEDGDICVICQDYLKEKEIVKRLQCKHIYHASCIDEWLERTLACPICMQEIPLVDLEVENVSVAPSGLSSSAVVTQSVAINRPEHITVLANV